MFGSIWLLGKTIGEFTTTHTLAGVLGVVALLALSRTDPNAVYSTEEYWQTASVENVQDVPEEALERGNKNGSVLMWAATGTKDPNVLTALISRGANINEEDEIYGGTALSAAAVGASDPVIIDMLVEHGAEVNRIIGELKKSPLLLAAEFNQNPQIIERLVAHGAKLSYRDSRGRTALHIAILRKNTATQPLLQELFASLEE